MIAAEEHLGLVTQAARRLTPEAFGSRYLEHFLNHAVRSGHYREIADYLHQMVTDPTEAARQAGARQLAVAAYRDPALDGEVDELLTSETKGERDVVVRAGMDAVQAERAVHVAFLLRLEERPTRPPTDQLQE